MNYELCIKKYFVPLRCLFNNYNYEEILNTLPDALLRIDIDGAKRRKLW